MDLAIENVQTYPRPPRLETAPHRLQVTFADQMIVDTTQALRVLETHHAPTYYIPRDEIGAELKSVEGRSMCEWKGVASYYDIVKDGRVAARAAWSYDDPTAKFRDLVDHIAIFASRMDACWVGGQKVEPQPGDFYGGWVTTNLTGIVKGGKGTEHW